MYTNIDNHNISEVALTLGSYAVKAALYEVSCSPSPGLVSRNSQGSHGDMDFFTFMDSTSALIKPFILFSQAGYSSDSPKQIFNKIRNIGIVSESEMFNATNGVNTHKGLLFLMGICCAASAKAIYENKKFEAIRDIIKEMTAGIIYEDLSSHMLIKKQELSHGEKLYLKYGIEGIRGEVSKGLPLIFDYSLTLYNKSKELNINDKLIHTLIGIMQICEDTNIIYRHSLNMLEYVQESSKNIMRLGGMYTTEGKATIIDLNEVFIRRNISPGGSADILAVTIFLNFIYNFMLQ
jgi:triphosphoribosyl-dephospho-CoA synthase